MNRNYILLTILMLALATGTLFLKKTPNYNEIKPQKLLWEIIQPTRYVTTDQVAKMIINKDQTLELVDVRDTKSYEKFSLSGAINVPLDSIAATSNQDYFGLPGIKVVFYSNDDIAADEAWVLTRRLGYKDTYVMKGGLNCWIRTVIQPQQPSEDAPYTEFEKYHFRKGAQIYFTGANIEQGSAGKSKVSIRRKKKKAVAAGGC